MVLFRKYPFIIRKFIKCIQKRNYVSALFLTGDKAKENFAVLTPYMNFTEVLEQQSSEMRSNLLFRKLNIDLDEVMKKYEIYKMMKNKEKFIENQREEITLKLRSTTSKEDTDSNEINQLKDKGKKLREELKLLKEQMFPVEEDFIDNFLKLPNRIHPKVHQSENTILYERTLPSAPEQYESHTQFENLIKFKNDSYYLFKEAAIFDTEYPFHCVEYFLKRGDFIQISNPDFSRTILFEAATITNCLEETIIYEESESKFNVNQLHLVGGASLLGFLGFITKMAIFSSHLPLKLISSGRQYNLSKENVIKCNNLYDANQMNSVQVFCATKSENEAQDEMEKIINLLIEIYNKLDVNYRIKYAKADEMLPAEMLSARIQIYSPVQSKYVNVGYVSNYSDFISKRLLFSVRDKKSNHQFPFIVSGTIVNTARIIACLLENRKNLLTSAILT